MNPADPASAAEPVSPAAPLARTFGRRWPLVLAIMLAVAHFAWIAAHLAPAINSPDANGYVVQARLLATEGKTFFATASPAQFVGMHWLETTDGVFHSRYPAGLPVLFALAWKLGGIAGLVLVNPLLASGTVLLVFLLARRIVSEGHALLAAAVLATNGVAQQHALDADSHAAAAFFLTAGLLALLTFEEAVNSAESNVGKKWIPLGLFAGVLLGAVPTIRYPEAIVGVTIAGWLLWRVRPIWRTWPAAVGAALPFGALLVHNATAYGAFWRTGYALTGEQTGFGWNYFTAHALGYLQALGGSGLGLIFAFGIAGLAGLVAQKNRRATGVLFAGVAVPLVLLYMAYYFGGGPGGAGDGAMAGNLRFLVPVFPIFAVAGVWLLAQVQSTLGPAGAAAIAVVAAIQLGTASVAAVQSTTRVHEALRGAAEVRAVLEKDVPPGSIVIVERQLGESLDATGQWKLVEEGVVGGGGLGGMGMGGRGAMAGRRAGANGPMAGGPMGGGNGDQPSPMQAQKNRGQRARYDGVSASERQTRVWADVRTWAAGRQVFWLARSTDAVDTALPSAMDFQKIAEVDAPASGMPGGGPGGGRPGAMMTGPMGGMGPGGAGGFGPPGMNGPGMGQGMMQRPGMVGGAQAQATKLQLVRIDLGKG